VADTPGYVLLEKGKDLTLNDLTNALKDKYDTTFIYRLYASMVREFESRDLKWSDEDKGATVEVRELGERALTIRERDICGTMFGSTVAYDAVTIHMTSKLGQSGITLNNDIYMDWNNSDIQSTWDSTLVHELTHVWQYQRLTGWRTKWICLPGYIFSRNGPYRINLADIKARKKFRDFGLDQQAEIVRMEYDLRLAGSSWHWDQKGNPREIGPQNRRVDEWYDDTTDPKTHWSFQLLESLIDLEHQLAQP
jgi:hypothetical protein